jgi:hypothetical protein
VNSTVCWYCNKAFDYDGEKYRDVDCLHCGVLNSIMNPDKPDWKPEVELTTTGTEWLNQEEEMGKLADRAREKSPFIKLEIGEETLALTYKSWKETTDNFGNETFRYFFELETDNGMILKQLDNRSQKFAEAMDKIAFGNKVILTREPKLDHEGEPVENKSIWTVRIVE